MKSNFYKNILNLNKSYIYSSLNEVKNLISQKKEFLFVNEEYLKRNNYSSNEYKGKEVILYESENKKFLIFPSETENINILEIYKNNSNLTQENEENQNNENNNSLNNIISDKFPNNNNKENNVKNKEMILKSLILLYAFEEHFLKLMNSPITIESDIKEYYLINKEWVDVYKSNYSYQNFISKLNYFELSFSYKEDLKDLDIIITNISKDINFISILNEIEKSINNNIDYLSNEENFIPSFEANKIDQITTAQCPINFILVPEMLFDLFFKGIKKYQYSKQNYKYHSLIGDYVLFIRNKKYDNIFYSYLLFEIKNILELLYIFIYNDSTKFNDEIKEQIKGKGFINYIINRQLKYKVSSEFLKLKDENTVIGNYKVCKSISIDHNLINKIETQNSLDKFKDIYLYYNKFMSNLFGLKDNKITISNINDIDQNNCISILIVESELLINYKEQLLFKQIEKLLKIKNNEEYDMYEKYLMEQLLYYHDFKSISDDIKHHFFILNQSEINSYLSIKTFSFLCEDLLLKINNDEDYKTFLNKQEKFLFFINNNEYFVYNPKHQKLYNALLLENTNYEFILKEYEFNTEFKNIIFILKSLYKMEKSRKDSIKKKFLLNDGLNISKYHLINKNWMKAYKNLFEYDSIIECKEIDEKKLIALFKNKYFTNYLKILKNLSPDYDNNYSDAIRVPTNFELVEKDIFESIIEDINTRNRINLKSNHYYNVMLGDNKIFVQDNFCQTLFFIYSLGSDKYDLEYIIILNDRNLFKFIKDNNDKQSFEELLSEYGIDFTKKNKQKFKRNWNSC